jgi:hypothetical protein
MSRYNQDHGSSLCSARGLKRLVTRCLPAPTSCLDRASGLGRRLDREGLGLDLAVAHDERVGAELEGVVSCLGGPEDVCNITLDRLLLQVEPGAGLGELGKEALKQQRHPVRAAQNAARREHNCIRRVVRQDARQVARLAPYEQVCTNGFQHGLDYLEPSFGSLICAPSDSEVYAGCGRPGWWVIDGLTCRSDAWTFRYEKLWS